MDIPTIELKGKKFKLVDFENEFTLERLDIAKDILTGIYGYMDGLEVTKDFKIKQGGAFRAAVNQLTIKQEAEILALIYWEEGKTFDPFKGDEYDETKTFAYHYPNYVRLFKTAPVKILKENRKNIEDFFDFATKYSMENSLISSFGTSKKTE